MSTEEELVLFKEKFQNAEAEKELLKRELTELKRLIFGSRSERFRGNQPPQNQPTLFDGIEELLPPVENPPEKTALISYQRKKTTTPKKQPVRGALPAHLPRIEEVIEPENIPDDAVKIGEAITEFLAYTPARIFVRKIIRPKYVAKTAKKSENTKVIIADLNVPFPRFQAGSSFIAQLFVSKFVDHLPFYRQRQIFKREGFEVSDSTLSGWFNEGARKIELLYEALQLQLLKNPYIQADESPIKVQDSHKKDSLHQGYHWVYHAPIEGLVLFKYDKSRSSKPPEIMLQGFEGTLQTDGYASYHKIILLNKIKHLACMAHARRKFEKALKNGTLKAQLPMEFFQRIYAFEAVMRKNGLKPEQIQQKREKYIRPLLEKAQLWLKEQQPKALPKSNMAMAINYSLKLAEQLKGYTQDGHYQIDNNLIENTIRPLAIGRKNYLFAGSHQAAQKAAMMYSFFGTCKINGINPLKWLTTVFNEIDDCKRSELHKILPCENNKERFI